MRRWVVSVVAVLVVMIGGCGLVSDENDYLGRDDSGDTPILERGSFEDARVRLDAMVDRMQAELTVALPDCPVEDPAEHPGDGDSVRGQRYVYEPDDQLRAYMMASRSRALVCSVSDTRERADVAIDIVTGIAEEYGFAPRVTYNDRIAPGGTGLVKFEGWNADGDHYRFGSALLTTISYTTAPRFTAEQLKAIADGRTPPQPDVTEVQADTPTPAPSPTPPTPSDAPTTTAPTASPQSMPTPAPSAPSGRSASTRTAGSMWGLAPSRPDPSPQADEVPDDTTHDRRVR